MEFRIPTGDSATASASFTAGVVRVKCSILPGAECQNVSHFRRGKASDVSHFSPVSTMQHQDKKPKLINYYRGCY